MNFALINFVKRVDDLLHVRGTILVFIGLFFDIPSKRALEESTTDWAVWKGVRDKSTNDTFWKNVHELILSGANVDRRNTRGETLLHVATWAYGKINFVRRLIEMGANLNARDNKGNTALHVAARMGREAVAKKLIEAGADVSVKNHKG